MKERHGRCWRRRNAMVRRGWLSLICSCALVGYACLPSRVSADELSQPNVLMILVDDLGQKDLGCYGNDYIKTPAIDSLAAKGIRFDQFYVASPICSPSRAALLTGCYPARFRIHSFLASRERNRRRGMADYLDPEAPSLARQFQQAGYRTGHFGKWHLGGGRDVDDAPHPRDYGFDESLVSFEGLGDRILPPGNLGDQSEALGQGNIKRVQAHEQTKIYVDRAIDLIERAQEEDEPFFVQLWTNDVHDPHKPSLQQLQEFRRRHGGKLDQLTPGVRDDAQENLFATLEALDEQVGRLLACIGRLEISNDTIVVLMGDNGPTAWASYEQGSSEAPGDTGGLRGRKWSLYEGGIRQPCLVSWPGKIPANRVDATTVLSVARLLPNTLSPHRHRRR